MTVSKRPARRIAAHVTTMQHANVSRLDVSRLPPPNTLGKYTNGELTAVLLKETNEPSGSTLP